MVNKLQIKQLFSQLGDKIAEQSWFQQLKTKWDELDPQSKSYLQITGLVLSILLVVTWSLGSLWKIHKLKREYVEKSELLSLLQDSNEELKRLQEKLSTSNQGSHNAEDAQPWNQYLESIAVTAGIDKTSLTFRSDRPEAGKDSIKEALIEVDLKKVNIKQIVRYAFQIENGTRPAKLRNLKIDTKNDPSGYMDSTFYISGFTLKNKEGS